MKNKTTNSIKMYKYCETKTRAKISRILNCTQYVSTKDNNDKVDTLDLHSATFK